VLPLKRGAEVRICLVPSLFAFTECTADGAAKVLDSLGEFTSKAGPTVIRGDEAVAKSRGGTDPFEGRPTHVGRNLPDTEATETATEGESGEGAAEELTDEYAPDSEEPVAAPKAEEGDADASAKKEESVLASESGEARAEGHDRR
jgi:hypothetical protein